MSEKFVGFPSCRFEKQKNTKDREALLSTRLNLTMKQLRTSDLGPLLGVLLLVVVLWAVQNELHAPHSHDIVEHITPLLPLSARFALFLIMLSSLAVLSHDTLATPFRRPISLILFRHVFRSGIARGSALAQRVRSSLAPFAGMFSFLNKDGGAQRAGRATALTRVVQDLRQWLLAFLPSLLAFSTFLYSAMLCVPDETLTVINSRPWLSHQLLLPGLAMSPFFGSVVAMVLLPVAYGVHRRIDAAYFLLVGLLALGAFLSLLSGSTSLQAVGLGLVLLVTSRCRKQFYRSAILVTERFTARWSASLSIVVLGLCSLGMFTATYDSYAAQAWWQLVTDETAPTVLRGAVAVLVMTIVLFTSTLLRAPTPTPKAPAQSDIDVAHVTVQQSHNTTANLALLGDKHFLFSESRNAFIMYNIQGRSWVACSDPVGPKEEAAALVWRFHELCDQHHGWTVFYQVSPAYLPVYLDLGLSLLKLGEEARVALATFSLDGKDRKPFRYVCNRLEKDSCTFELIPPHAVQPVLPELKVISDTWLAAKNRREKGFSLGFFDPAYLQLYPTAVVRQREKIIAFANLWSSADKDELSPDLMRYLPDAPEDAMEYLLIKLMLWGKREGYRWFNLGMAPLSGLEDRALAPLWNQVGAFVFRHGESFYNFQGLRRYKEKFDPIWEPRYLAIPQGLALPRILTNVTTLISGGVTGVVRK